MLVNSAAENPKKKALAEARSNNNQFASGVCLLCAKSYVNEKNLNNDASKDWPTVTLFSLLERVIENLILPGVYYLTAECISSSFW